MKYAKMLGLLAVASAALLAFASSALATYATSPKPGELYPTGKTIHAEAGVTTLHGAATITCNKSTVSSTINSQGGGSNETLEGPINTLDFTECDNHVTVLAAGSLIAHTDESDPNGTSGNATVTSVGARITIQITNLGISCVFGTVNNPTDIGTLTGSKQTGGTATLHIHGTIKRESEPHNNIFCGGSGTWTGTYTVTTPDYLDIN